MRKLTILFSLLTLTVGLWANDITYTAVKVSDGETTITLYNAKTVDYEVK